MYYKKEFGNEGEYEACCYLEKNNYIIIFRNFSCKMGEIDIIAFDLSTNEYVFIEVKSRSQGRYGSPVEAVDNNKIQHIRQSAEYYSYKNNIEDSKFRFDIIEIYDVPHYKTKIHHIKQAFDF